MRLPRLFALRPDIETLVSVAAFLLCVGVNLVANLLRGTPRFYFIYQGGLAVGVCTLLPLLHMVKSGQPLSAIGVQRNWITASAVAALLVAASVPWRFRDNPIAIPEADLLLYTCSGLLLSAFFEELFFRGFLQTRFEKAFGLLPSIVLSGAAFSLYHIGYPDYRDPDVLLTLFCVGIFFAVAFRLTNNVLTSILVNFPHAIVSFLEKEAYIHGTSTLASLIALAAGIWLVIRFGRKSAT